MQQATQFLAFVVAAYGLAVAIWPILSIKGPIRWLAFVASAAAMCMPLLISRQHVMLRALACLVAIDLFFKINDYARLRRASSTADSRFLAFAKFLIPFPLLLVRFEQRVPRSRPDLTNWHITLWAWVMFGLCFALLDWSAKTPAIQSSFLLDHTIKFVTFTIAIELSARGALGLERFAGFDTKPLIARAFLSGTVGEFWHRYNTRVHSWFDANVFRPAGGRRSPVPAICATFFVSAVLHEIGFAIATSRIDGYQFAFFMIQAPAVILWRVGQRWADSNRVGSMLLRLSTIVWMWATSMLFFHGVNRVFPIFYASDPWLP